MKITNVINWVLKIIGFGIGFLGILFIIGSPGSYEQGRITLTQLLSQELEGLLFVCSAFGVYVIREIFKYKFMN